MWLTSLHASQGSYPTQPGHLLDGGCARRCLTCSLTPCLPSAISPSPPLTSDYQEGALDSAENCGGRVPLFTHPGGPHGPELCNNTSSHLPPGQSPAPSNQLNQPR